MWETIKKEGRAQFVVILFLLLTAFWVTLQTGVFDGKILFNHSYHKLFGALYGFVALLGALWGLNIAKQWGGTKSVMGKSIVMFSLALFAQEFGQLSLSYLDYAYNIAGAYPSIGDLGYFGSIPLYALGVYYLAKASGVNISLQLFTKKLQAILIPAGMLFVGYFLFLRGYEFDWSSPIKVFLDLGYPLGDAMYVSLAILTYLLSRGVLGGIMKSKILFLLFALGAQFVTDYTFLYQSSRGTWTVGGINDYMYLTTYFLMTLALLQLKTVHDQLRST